ncbi:MAG: hypothetical protein AAGB93_21955 [Planctomycetota bacterium]
METNTPTLVALFVLAGIVAGATASAVGAVLGPRPTADRSAPVSVQFDSAYLRTLEERIQRFAERQAQRDEELVAPAPLPRTEVGGGSAATIEALAEIAEKLDALTARLSAMPRGAGTALPSNANLAQTVNDVGVDDALETHREGDDEALRQRFMLLSMEEAVERFGRPSESTATDGGIQLKWERPGGKIYIRFVDGRAATAFGSTN